MKILHQNIVNNNMPGYWVTDQILYYVYYKYIENKY